MTTRGIGRASLLLLHNANPVKSVVLGVASTSSTQLATSSLHPTKRRSISSQRSFSLIYTPVNDRDIRLAKVPERSIISFEGRDTIKLLQGLLTNNVKQLSPTQTLYCAFLNPQGRMLSSAFLFSPKEDCVLVDVDAEGCADLLAFIKRFKLRSKVVLKDVSQEYQIWAMWGNGAKYPSSSRFVQAGGQDPRSPLMGYRFITSKETSEENIGSLNEAPPSSPESYTIHRILQGVPDGSNDIWQNQSLPLEANVDFMNGVDFRKGCYVGQELTARTHHTGIVRKRVIPFSFYKVSNSFSPPDHFQVDTSLSYKLPEKGTEIRSIPLHQEESTSARGKSTGKYLSGIHNIGLGLLRLDQVHRWNKEFLIKVKVADESELLVRPWIPSWWPQDAQAPPQ